MDVGVLDYNTCSVIVYRNVDEKYVEEKYNGNISNWLRWEKGHKETESFIMASDNISLYEEEA